MEKTKMDIKVIEGYLVGINVDTDALHFSKIPRGSEGIKNITLENNDERSHLVQLKAYGNISQFIYVSENNFVMGPHTSKNMSVIARVPSDTEIGYYEGELYVIFMNMP